MNQPNNSQRFSIRKYALGTFSTLVATYTFLLVSTHIAHANEHTNFHVAENKNFNTSVKYIVSNNKPVSNKVISNSTSNNITIQNHTSILVTKYKNILNEISELLKNAKQVEPNNIKVNEAQAFLEKQNSLNILNYNVDELNNLIHQATQTRNNLANINTRQHSGVHNKNNGKSIPNTAILRSADNITSTSNETLIKPTFISKIAELANTKQAIEIVTSPNTTVILLDHDGATMGTGTTDNNGHVTITPTEWIPEGNVIAKATRGNESISSDPIKAINIDPDHRPFLIRVTTDPLTNVELRDRDNLPLGRARTNDKGIAYVVPTRPIPEGNVTAVATDDSGNSSVSDPKRATDTTPPAKPVIHTNLIDKVDTLTPIEITTDPNTKVELFDKNNILLGSGMTDTNGHITITPNKPLIEGPLTAKATDDALTPNSSFSDPANVTDLTPPAKPYIVGGLTGKATKQDPIEVVSDKNIKIEIFDKDNHLIGTGITDTSGHVIITPIVPVIEGDVTVKATDNAEHPNSSTSDPVKATDTTPPRIPKLVTNLNGRAKTKSPIEVITDPNTKVEIFDKDNHIIGTGVTDGSGHAMIIPTVLIPEGDVSAKATDNAEHPNSSISSTKKATDLTPPTMPTLKGDLIGKAGTKTPIEVITDVHTRVEILDKYEHIIGSGITDENGHVVITPSVPLSEGDIVIKAIDDAESPNSIISKPIKVTDTTAPIVPTLETDLTNTANTKTPIKITTDPFTLVELLDKEGHIIGKGTTDASGHALVIPIEFIPEGDIYARATDNAEHPNSSLSSPKKATLAVLKNEKNYNQHLNTIQSHTQTNYSTSDTKHKKFLPNTGINHPNHSVPIMFITLIFGFALLGRSKGGKKSH